MIVTVSAPSGTGKTTLIRKLLDRDRRFRLLTSSTTRQSRGRDELDGEMEHLSEHDFDRLEDSNAFIWTVDNHGRRYALRHDYAREAADDDNTVALISLIPAIIPTIQDYAPAKVKSFFLLPPDENELRRRLAGRGEPPEQVKRRIEDCRQWVAEARSMADRFIFLENNEKDVLAKQVLDHIDNWHKASGN